MRNSIVTLLNETLQRMSGYAVYMNYQFMHFSVNAEPAALLSVNVEVGGEPMEIEDVADVALPADDQFALIPKDKEYLFPICKAIGLAHPEYKIEQKSMNEDEEEDGASNTDTAEHDKDGEDNRYVLCTMPPMTKERRDAGMDYVQMVYGEVMVKVDAANVACGVKMAKQLAGAKPAELDEAKEELQKLYDRNKDLCKQYRETKEKQIEDAYQKYLTEQAAKESAEKERMAARDEEAGKRMKF